MSEVTMKQFSASKEVDLEHGDDEYVKLYPERHSEEIVRATHNLSVMADPDAEENKKQEPVYKIEVLILLFVAGLTTGVINGCTLWAVKMLSIFQSRLLVNYTAGPLYLIITTTTMAACSAFVIMKGRLPATIGTGMPEVKALMVNDFLPYEFPRIVSFKILCLRIVSVVLAAGSGLSVGLQGPSVHISVCIAYTLMLLIPKYEDLRSNSGIMKQIFAASAAVGLATIFNAPVGGLLFSVEVTSAYYLISNYWRSFMAATTGAVMFSIFLIDRPEEARIFQIDYMTNPFWKWEFPFYAAVGAIAGVLSLGYLRVHQMWWTYTRKFMGQYPVSTAGAAGAITALLIYAIGAHSNNGVTVSTLVHDCFKEADISDMQTYNISRVGGLFISMLVRVFLTFMDTCLNISAGMFMPMLSIGAMLGRIIGQLVADSAGAGGHVYVAGYAMVGAAAFVSGTTHTISCAVIVIEMTGQINMLLPCLIGAVVSCGISKTFGLSLYDQGMVNKGLESFELLLSTNDGFADVMDSGVVSVNRHCILADLFAMLQQNLRQTTFPIIQDIDNHKLLGSVSRHDVFQYLKIKFEANRLGPYLRLTLPKDCERMDKLKERQESSMNLSQNAFNLASNLRAMVNDFASGNNSPSFGSPKAKADNGQAEGNTTEESPLPRGESSSGKRSSGSMSSIMGTTNPLTTAMDDSMNDGEGSHISSADLAKLTAYVQKPENKSLIDELIQQPVDLVTNSTIKMNGFPFTVSKNTTIDRLYVLFEMVKVQCVFVVTEKDKLVGMINKDLLLKRLRSEVK